MIIAPKQVPIILDSNISIIEENIAVWDAETSYLTHTIVQVNDQTHRKYKASKDATNINPVDDVNPVTGVGTYWLDYGSTNYMRAFDELGSSKCSNVESIYYKFQTSDLDLLLLEGLSSAAIRIKIVNTDSSVILIDEEFSTVNREVYDWFDWTYAVSEQQSSFFKILPMAYNTTMEIWINNPSGTASVGHLAFGRSKRYGLVLADPKPTSSRRSVTSKTRNEFGEIITRRKARYRKMTIHCSISGEAIDVIEDRLEEIVDTACIFVGDEQDGGFKALLIYGEMRDHDMPISLEPQYQLEVEGYL